MKNHWFEFLPFSSKNKKRAHRSVLSFRGKPEGIRTPDLLVRSCDDTIKKTTLSQFYSNNPNNSSTFFK